MSTVTISSKYQVVIPREIRDLFGLQPGQKLEFIPYKQTLRLVVVPEIAEAKGVFAGMDSDPQREKSERSL